MSMTYIRQYYKVPAKRGIRVIVIGNGKKGIITSSYNSYIKVRIDGERRSGIYHPNDVTYLETQPAAPPSVTMEPTGKP